jgi:hypothetical protein
MKLIPISVILASVVLFIFSAVTVYLHPLQCLAIAVVVLLAASAIRVAYFVIEGE